jgi:hypothetical protein
MLINNPKVFSTILLARYRRQLKILSNDCSKIPEYGFIMFTLGRKASSATNK